LKRKVKKWKENEMSWKCMSSVQLSCVQYRKSLGLVNSVINLCEEWQQVMYEQTFRAWPLTKQVEVLPFSELTLRYRIFVLKYGSQGVNLCSTEHSAVQTSTLRSYCSSQWSLRDRSFKNKISVIIYSPLSCSKPLWVYFFCWTQKKIFE